MRHKQPSGFSLIEAAIVLGIIGLTLGGIWVAASTVNTNLKISRTAEGMLFICNKATKLFTAKNAPATDEAVWEPAISAKAVPADWITDPFHFKSPISDTNVLLYHMGQGNGAATGVLLIQLQNVPVSYCQKFMSSFGTALRDPSALYGIEMMDITEIAPATLIAPYTGRPADSCQPTGAAHPTTMYRIYCAPGI